jgi:predicted RND superfamily exporter protein
MSDRLAGFLYRYRRLLTAVILLGAVALAPRANITRIDNELTAWFSREDPVYREYERFQDEFGGTRTLIVAIQAPSRERLFTREAFEMLDAIGDDIERVPAVERVATLASATIVDARAANGADQDAVLDVRPLIDDLATKSPAALGERAIADDLLRGDLISEDGTVTSVVVFFDERRVDDVRAQVIAAINGIVKARLPPDFRYYVNGSLEISETYNRITLENQTKFTPPILLCTVLAIFAMFRSWRRTLLTLGAVLVSVVWTIGLYDLFGFNFNVLSSMIVPLVIVLAIADDVHIIQHYQEERRRGTAEQAFKKTVSHLMAPLFAASGTTALGMASLATSQVVAVREFGLGSAIGVMVDFAISIILMPTMLGWLKPEPRLAPQEAWFLRPMEAVARLSTRHARMILVVASAIAVVATLGLLRLRVDTNHINFFSPRHPLGESAAVIDTKLSGIYTFQILLEGPPDSLAQPDALRRMDRLEQELRPLPFVRKVTGVVDYVKRVHLQLAGVAAVPEDAPAVAQELFVFSLADAGRAELEHVASSDMSRAQITVKLASMSSDLVFEQVGIAQQKADEIFAGSDVTPTVTGSGKLFAILDHYLVVSQISSFATAFVTVFAVIFLVFRSWRFGALAIVPNLFPVLAIFGVMGWLDITLNVATVMLASVALGIVDDDTIHFISRYRRETAHGAGTDEAIVTATRSEGRAALTTAIINSCSFMILATSEYKPSAWFGLMLAATMGVAFLAEVFILPATIKAMPRLFGADRVHAVRRAHA